MKKNTLIYLITIVVAFCSIVYELILSQSLSAILGNTILRYSTTIGLYLFSMGVGAFLAGEKMAKNPFWGFLKIETLLTLLGGFSVGLIFLLSFSVDSYYLFSFLAYSYIALIGVLTGIELPLLIAMAGKEKSSLILGLDYFGAFLGSLAFAFIFYPTIGLFPAAFLTGTLNAIAGVATVFFRNEVSEDKKNRFVGLLGIQVLLFIVVFGALLNSSIVNDYFLNKYLTH